MNTTDYMRAMGKPIAYYPKLAKPLGGVSSAILFSQLFYWQDKATSDLGVYKTRDELEDETGLSHNEQRTAIKKLCERGVLIVTEKRLEHKTYYKINNEKVNEVLNDFAKSMIELSRNVKNIAPELDIVEVETNTKSSSLYQEITTEITTNNNTSSCDDKSKPEKKDVIDFDLIKNAYNDAVKDTEFPPIRSINTARKYNLKKLIKCLEDSTVNGLINYFYDFAEKAPDWTRGKTNLNFVAHFDYIIESRVYIRFIEGSL